MADTSEFKKLFLEKYLAGGFGAMPKKEIDTLVMFLLDNYGCVDSIPMSEFRNYEVGLKLKLSPSKVKSIRYDGKLKYSVNQELNSKQTFLKAVEEFRYEVGGDFIILLIDDIFTRNWFQEQLRNKGLVYDNSFNSDVVKLTPEAFRQVFYAIFKKTIPPQKFEWEDFLSVINGVVNDKIPGSEKLLGKVSERLKNIFIRE